MCVAKHAQITQNNKFSISLQYLKEEMSDEVDFLHTDKHENLLTNWCYDFDGDGRKRWQSSQNSNLAMTPCNISKKVGIEFILCMQINTKVSTSWYYWFRWKWPEKSIATAFVFYCDAKHSDILRGSSNVNCYLFLGYRGYK